MMNQRPHCSEFPALVESCGITFCHQHTALAEYAGTGMMRAALNLAMCNQGIHEVAPDHYLVDSREHEGLYYLTSFCTDSGLPICSCRTYRFYAETHDVPICQHVFAVQFYREALAAYQAFEREYEAIYPASVHEGIEHDQTAVKDGKVQWNLSAGYRIRHTRIHRRCWQRFDAERKAELAYIKAERAGIAIDTRPLERTLKVEEFSYSFGPARAIYAMIRLKGRWLAKIFPPNSRVVVEAGEGYLTLRSE